LDRFSKGLREAASDILGPWLGRAHYVAHRGAQTEHKENTKAALLAGLRTGIAECDVHCTVDGHLVVCHDGTLARTAENDGSVSCAEFNGIVNTPIAELTLAEVQRIPVGKGESAPALRTILEAIGPDQLLFVEIKGTGDEAKERTLQALTELDQEFHGRFILIGFDYPVMSRAKVLLPALPALLLVVSQPATGLCCVSSLPQLRQVLEQTQKAGLDGLGFEFAPFLIAPGQQFSQTVRDGGLVSFVWSAKRYDQADIAEALANEGYDFVNTDTVTTRTPLES
jgi:glycerophosphoryl diester phosphodiesterase